jgi:hypothetical protein
MLASVQVGGSVTTGELALARSPNYAIRPDQKTKYLGRVEFVGDVEDVSKGLFVSRRISAVLGHVALHLIRSSAKGGGKAALPYVARPERIQHCLSSG